MAPGACRVPTKEKEENREEIIEITGIKDGNRE